MSVTVSIDNALSNFHRGASARCVFPISGTIVGGVKATAGVVEVVASLLFILAVTLPSLFSSEGRGLLNWGIEHLGKGCIRTLISIPLAIPFIGFLTYFGVVGASIGLNWTTFSEFMRPTRQGQQKREMRLFNQILV